MSAEKPTRPTPEGPSGRTITDKLVEKPMSTSKDAPEPPDADSEMSYQAMAFEHQRKRNLMIQRNGGYLEDNEQEAVPVDENGQEILGPKMSRFKAARLAQPNK